MGDLEFYSNIQYSSMEHNVSVLCAYICTYVHALFSKLMPGVCRMQETAWKILTGVSTEICTSAFCICICLYSFQIVFRVENRTFLLRFYITFYLKFFLCEYLFEDMRLLYRRNWAHTLSDFIFFFECTHSSGWYNVRCLILPWIM